jgi:hypothetical protein
MHSVTNPWHQRVDKRLISMVQQWYLEELLQRPKKPTNQEEKQRKQQLN